MTKRMLIDATHAEETRVVVLDGNRLVEYDVETQTKKQLKGNIYLAKVVRVEPSLQAAFVEYGGNRHGFLAFGEIHPDYYQIPVADRQRLIELQEQEAREDDDDDDDDASSAPAGPADQECMPAADDASGPDAQDSEPVAMPEAGHVAQALPIADAIKVAPQEAATDFPPDDDSGGASGDTQSAAEPEPGADCAPEAMEPAAATDARPAVEAGDQDSAQEPEIAPEMLGGEHDTSDDISRERRQASRLLRHYKIQEVIRRRQIILVQVTKEERGGKGAALTTYISLAGRYSVLMPNSPRGGGVSRKITSAADRRRLKEITSELELPRGMGIIVRTAGANRPKPEIKRDCESLLRMWDDIRDHTLKSVAPALIYEEASLIKRAIRDSYSNDVEEVQVDGEAGWRAARDFMRMMMPTHAKKVQLWGAHQGGHGSNQPLFSRYQIEAQLDSMFQPHVSLRSGGSIVINQTEALVAIDVNSGRSTRERGIEETALRTNLEAAEEVARQLRLRDLAGLIVIDFIDMEARRHNAMVERRLRDALAVDRARIQLGHISHFGLLEMSRQRLRPSLTETSFVPCPRCAGTGHVRGTESVALHVLRAIEDEGAKRRAAEIVVHVSAGTALYILNNKRDRLTEIENRHHMRVAFAPDETLLLSPYSRIERLRPQTMIEANPVMMREAMIEAEDVAEIGSDMDDVAEDEMGRAEADGPATAGEDRVSGEDREGGRGRRRRRRRGGRRNDNESASEDRTNDTDAAASAPEGGVLDPASADQPDTPEAAFPHIRPSRRAPRVQNDASADESGHEDAQAAGEERGADAQTAEDADATDGPPRRRRRRGGRRRGQANIDETADTAEQQAENTEQQATPPMQPSVPSYSGPTPANPFGGLDIFDALEQAMEQPSPAMPDRAANPVHSSAQPEADAAPGSEGPNGPTPGSDAQGTEDAEDPAALRPVLIGDAPAAQKKRGWWRRS